MAATRLPAALTPLRAVQASIAANTYVVSGPSQTKSACAPLRARSPPRLIAHAPHPPSPAELQDMLPGIINQLGPDNLANLKRLAQQFQGQGGAGGAGGDDDVPEVDTFDG